VHAVYVVHMVQCFVTSGDKTVICSPRWYASDQYGLLIRSVVSVVTSVKPAKITQTGLIAAIAASGNPSKPLNVKITFINFDFVKMNECK